jgi:hypothetical protein
MYGFYATRLTASINFLEFYFLSRTFRQGYKFQSPQKVRGIQNSRQ